MVGLHVYSLHALSPLYSDDVAYLCTATAVACSAVVSAFFARSSHGSTRYRWALVAIALTFRALDYIGATSNSLHQLRGLAQRLNAWFDPVGATLFIFALTAVYAMESRLIRFLDLVLVVVLCGLRYAVEHLHGGIFPNSANYLAFVLLVHIFILLAASIARLAARDEDEARFARLMIYLAAMEVVTDFCCNQVGYLWLHQTSGSPWFLTSTIGEFGFAYIALKSFLRREPDHLLRSPSLLARSIMPFFLSIASIVLGIRLLPVSLPFGISGIVAAVLCYAGRMAYVQRHYMMTQNNLLSRNTHLEGLVDSDPLTGLGNRRSLASALDRHCAEAFAVKTSVYLLLLDVDGLKQVNDNLGHIVGDQCLVEIASALKRELKPTHHHLLRHGDDEFAVVLRAANTREAMLVAEYLRSAVEELELGTNEFPISVSIGIAAAAVPRPAIGHLIESADRALYCAKSLGRNRVEFEPHSLS
jgi:diguanylate cyclase (GGDEF)-like protein